MFSDKYVDELLPDEAKVEKFDMTNEPPLNSHQKLFVNRILKHHRSGNKKQLRIVLSGGAGTGKSRCIKELKSELKDQCVTVAVTAQAAYAVGGDTIAKQFMVLRFLTDNLRDKIRHKNKDVKYIIIEEYGLVGQRMLFRICDHLRQALA